MTAFADDALTPRDPTESLFLAELAAREVDAVPHGRLRLEDAAELVPRNSAFPSLEWPARR